MPAVPVSQTFALALQHHQAGRLAEAGALYRQILAIQPQHAETLHYLGVIAQQMGRFDVAVDLIRRALVLDPQNPAALSNLGAALAELGQCEEAVTAYERALQMQPDSVGTHLNLGNAQRALGKIDEAIGSYRRALELRPDLPQASNNLGIVLAEQGQPDQAIAAYREALRLQPHYPEAWNNLGNVLRGRGQLNEAVAAYHEALRLKADYPEAHGNLGLTLAEQGKLGEAAAACRRAIQLKPDYAEAHSNLGNVLAEQGLVDEAEAAHRRALEIKPGFVNAWNNLGHALKEQGRLEEALGAYRQALRLNPWQAGVQSNLIYTLLFHPNQDTAMIAAEQQRWNRQFAEPLRSLILPHANDHDPERRLRIGYVSPDFHRHPICQFFVPLLEAHDAARVEVYGYASVKSPDALTNRVKRRADVWRDVLGLDDHALAEQIRADRIDILVDLTQHMADNRLPVFALKPAPIQVAWLGYPASTGLPAMDYRLTDEALEPRGSSAPEAMETPIRLPDCWFCFHPIESPEPSPLPALRTGLVTFGSLNNFCKINEPVLRLWATLLQAVEGSRLLLYCPEGSTQTRLREGFAAQGIAASRLELVARTATRMEYLALHGRIDIGLDPFPYNGGTTTCEALWMGVPVVTLAGRAAVSRLGLSVLTNLGLPGMVASSEEEYLRIATQLARDLPRLAELRTTLRTRMQTSPLMDAPRFARNVETAYRMMWRRWCAANPAPPQ